MPSKLNIGCGEDILEGYVNVDQLPLDGVEVVHNLLFIPWPFEDESADEVRAVDVLEHLPNYAPDWRPMVPAFIEECYRILAPEGVLFIQAPRYDAEFLYLDPTHVRGFHERSMDFFDPKTDFGRKSGFYSHAHFTVDVQRLENRNLQFYMVKQ